MTIEELQNELARDILMIEDKEFLEAILTIINYKSTGGQKEDSIPRNKKTDEFEEPETDFGGFPDRDLKKNLGCGG